MLLSVVGRTGRSVLVVLLVTLAVMGLMSLAPGSVAAVILGENATPDAIAEMNADLGMDRSFLTQFASWVGDAITGDLGVSPLTGESVADSITTRLPVTLQLAAMALVIALLVSMLLAVLSAARPDGLLDRDQRPVLP